MQGVIIYYSYARLLPQQHATKAVPETAKPKCILTPPPLSRTYAHGTVKAEEEQGA